MPDDFPSVMLLKRWFYQQYQWSPDQVAAMPLEELVWLPIVEQAIAEVQEAKARQEQARQEHRQNSPQRPRMATGM